MTEEEKKNGTYHVHSLIQETVIGEFGEQKAEEMMGLLYARIKRKLLGNNKAGNKDDSEQYIDQTNTILDVEKEMWGVFVSIVSRVLNAQDLKDFLFYITTNKIEPDKMMEEAVGYFIQTPEVITLKERIKNAEEDALRAIVGNDEQRGNVEYITFTKSMLGEATVRWKENRANLIKGMMQEAGLGREEVKKLTNVVAEIVGNRKPVVMSEFPTELMQLCSMYRDADTVADLVVALVEDGMGSEEEGITAGSLLADALEEYDNDYTKLLSALENCMRYIVDHHEYLVEISRETDGAGYADVSEEPEEWGNQFCQESTHARTLKPTPPITSLKINSEHGSKDIKR